MLTVVLEQMVTNTSHFSLQSVGVCSRVSQGAAESKATTQEKLNEEEAGPDAGGREVRFQEKLDIDEQCILRNGKSEA